MHNGNHGSVYLQKSVLGRVCCILKAGDTFDPCTPQVENKDRLRCACIGGALRHADI